MRKGVALAGALLGITCTDLFMPLQAAKTKIEATRNYGAEVILAGETFDDTKQITLEAMSRSGEVFVSPLMIER